MTRRNFSPKTKGLIRKRSGGVCEVHRVPRCMYPALPESCTRQASEVDHVTPDYAGGEPTVENGADLCGLCHKVKTVTDNKMAKKSNRLKGNSQADRRQRKKEAGTYRQIQSRGFAGSRKFNGEVSWKTK